MTYFPERVYTAGEVKTAKELVDKGYKHDLTVEGSSEFKEKVNLALELIKTAGYFDFLKANIRKIIEIDGIEPPVGDGSALPYVEVLLKAGFVQQEAPKDYLIIDKTVAYHNNENQIDIVALPLDSYRVTVMVDYQNPALGSQHTGLFDLEKEFVDEFAPARTFCFLSEVEQLINVGLI